MMEGLYGQLFLEAAPILTKSGSVNIYDWATKKVCFKINPPCLDSLLLSLYEFHVTDKEQNGKRLTFARPPTEEEELGGVLTLSDENQKLFYTFTHSDIVGLGILLTKAKERIYGW